MGLGRFGGGAGAARFLAEQGYSVTVTDLRDERTLAPSLKALEGLDIRFVLGGHAEDDFSSCEMLVVNPAVRPGARLVELARARGACVTSELETALEEARRKDLRVFLVTGSNGKSTTAAMLAPMLRASGRETGLAGNIGRSALLEAARLSPGAALVLEVSSFQLAWLGRPLPAARAAVLTGLSPNHLDWHGTLDAYYGAKRKVTELLAPGGTLVLNQLCEASRPWADAAERALWFSSAGRPPGDGVWVEGGKVLCGAGEGPEVLMQLEDVPVRGPHEIEDMLAATAAARAEGLRKEAMLEGLRAFRPLPHRLEEVARAGGVRFVNDSAATTPESTIAALSALEGRLVLIAGGHDKGLDYRELARAIAQKASGLVVMGKVGERIARGVASAGGALPVLEAPDLEAALDSALNMVGEEGTILLSPAASSKDAFADYEERGERFKGLALRAAELMSSGRG